MIIPDNLLKNKNVLLGVTGSIAVYKSLELIRLLVKSGANVKVIMSDAAKKFVSPLSFETLSSNQVLDDTNESWVNDHNHIKITAWADLFVIAPCTANTLAKLANGIADNILLQSALAHPKMKLLAPSANTHMIQNSITQANTKKLMQANYRLVDTQTKELACKTTGDGAMAEPLDIFWASARELLKNQFWNERRVIVTGGGTIEKIDDVRYISNFSSGKMASAMSSALYCMGAYVTMISSRFENDLAKDINIIEVQSSQEMLESLNNNLTNSKEEEEEEKKYNKKPYLFMAAAVSDYIPNRTESGKLKKDTLGENFDLSLKKNVDILTSINKKNIITVGFKAEMDQKNAKVNALNMLTNKKLDAVCLNILKDSSSFGSNTNTIEFISTNQQLLLPEATKLKVAFEILKQAEGL